MGMARHFEVKTVSLPGILNHACGECSLERISKLDHLRSYARQSVEFSELSTVW
jgi:hypothetical protein